MKGKKSILFLIVVLLCLVAVGCGKNKEEKEKEEKTSSVQTLKCSNESDGSKVSMEISQNKKTYELTKATMTMSSDISEYRDLGLSDENLKKLMCSDEDSPSEYKSCDAKIEDDTITVVMEFDLKQFEDELVDDDENEIEKMDGETLKKLKESAEKEGYTCKIS